MSVYLGLDKVGVSYLTKANTYDFDLSVMDNNIYTPWTRPNGWPDLDSLNLEMSGTDSFIYMTYRTGHIDDVCAFTLNTVSGTATISLGAINNGVFTATLTETVSSGGIKRYWFTSNEGYSEGTIVVKVTGRLSRFYLIDSTRDNSLGGGTIKWYMLPMLERIWYIPDLISFNSGTTTSSNGNGTYTLERDKIANGTGTALTSLYYAWWSCYELLSLDISGLYTPNVTTMACAFEYCRKLESLDMRHFDTAKVTSISYMFDFCIRIKELDLSTWNTNKLTTTGLSYTFRNCMALKQIIGLDKIYTNNLTSLVATFQTCRSLEDLSDITNWNTSKVTNLSSTFAYCYKIKKLNLSKWDITKVTTVQGMFNNCRSLEHILFPQGQTSTLTGSQSSIFLWCLNLLEVDLTWLKPFTNAVTSIGYMFYYCRSLKEINIPEGWDITGCTASESCHRMFSNCYMVEHITGISNWDMSGYNYTMANAFENDYALKELNIKNWCPHPTSMYYFFSNCWSLEEIDLTGWHWENMTGTCLNATFTCCHSLKSLKGIEHMGDSGNATNLASCFSDCWSLTSIPSISSWNVEKVTTCASMFYNDYSLRSLTITNWSLPKCTTITNMFYCCYSMRELELTGWTLSGLTVDPDYIFYQMYSLIKCSGLPIKLMHRYREAYLLPEDQWIRIFNLLPTVSNKTLYISTVNINRLSSTTKAIATNKGWTLAN